MVRNQGQHDVFILVVELIDLCWQASSAGRKVDQLTADLVKYLKEGVLQEDFILDNIPRLMGLMRDANVTLRWIMLHCASLQACE